MTSPTETPPASNAELESAKKTYEHFEAWGVKLPLPRWSIVGIGILALLGAAASASLKIWQPQTKAGPSEDKVVLQPTPPQTSSQGHKVSDVDMIDYQESLKHTDEKPKKEQIILSSADLGTLKVRFFISDRCLQIIRRSAGANPQITSHYIPAAKMEDRAPGKIDPFNASLLQDSVVDSDLLAAQLEPASYNLPNESVASPPAGNCWNPHPADFRWWNGEARGCWIQVWRAWADGCQHYQWFNTCNGYWDSEPNGAPRVYWTNCVH